MKKVISFISVMTIIFMLVIGIHTSTYAATTNKLNITVKYGQTEARKMLKMINEFRTGNDAWCWNEDNTKKESWKTNAITYDYNLEKIAMQRAAEIALLYDHTRPNGGSCFTAYTGVYSSEGENIAAGYGTFTTAKSVFTAWQEKDEKYLGQGHRRNMLYSGFNAVGIGHVYYNGAHYWVQEFGNVNLEPTVNTANDKDTAVSIDVLSSNIKSYSVKASKSSLSVGYNKKVSLPEVNTIANIVGGWPTSSKPINASCTWKVENSKYAKISGNKVVGLKIGKTNLVTTVYGKKVTVPITITPATPENVKASSQKTTSLKLSWSKVPEATGYRIYQYNTKTKKYKKIATTKGKSYTVKKLKAGTTYKFKVVAYKNVGKKQYTSSYSKVLTTATKPTTPKISRLTTKSKKATVQWKKISGASGYEVYMATSKKGKYSKVKTVTKGTTVKYTKSSLKKNKKYYFKVRAYKTVDGKKVYSSYSSVKSIKIR